MLHKVASPLVVKFGGNAMGAAAEARLAAELAGLHAEGRPLVIVHGGGPEIDEALEAEHIAHERVGGLRVTSERALAITQRVLCGVLNKRIVSALLGAGVPAVGISGLDGAMLRATRQPELGWVGTQARADARLPAALLEAGYVPVIAPLAFEMHALTPLNVNADTAAAAIASALDADCFVLLTNVERVLADTGDARSGVAEFTLPDALAFAASAHCRDSMRPKMQAAIDAVQSGVALAAIGNAGIAELLAGAGTLVRA